MLTSPRLPDVHPHRDKRPGVDGYYVIVDVPPNREQGHPYEPLFLYITKGKANGEFGMTTPGRWYITSRLSHHEPTGRGREGYPTKAAAILHIRQWLANPDNGETWS